MTCHIRIPTLSDTEEQAHEFVQRVDSICVPIHSSATVRLSGEAQGWYALVTVDPEDLKEVVDELYSEGFLD